MSTLRKHLLCSAIGGTIVLLVALYLVLPILLTRVLNPHVPTHRGPPDCAYLYNVGLSNVWADCMGVGYK